MDAERAMLQALMTRRRNLIAQLVAQNGERGRLLAWTILRTADSLLSRDLEALQRYLDRQSPGQPVQAPEAVTATSSGLGIAEPGQLWSPDTAALSAGALAWQAASDVISSTPPSAHEHAAPATAVALSFATLASLDLPLTVRQWPPASSTDPSPAAADTPTPVVPAAPPTPEVEAGLVPYTVPVDDAGYVAQSHAGLTVDSGAGPQAVSTANGDVAAALALPVTSTAPIRPRDWQPFGAPQVPDRATLQRRLAAVAGTLARVRAMESWLRVDAPSGVLTAGDAIPSTDVLRQRADHWMATIPLGAQAAGPAPAAAYGGTAPRAATADGTGPDAAQLPVASQSLSGATVAFSQGAANDPAAGVALYEAVSSGSAPVAYSVISDSTDTGIEANWATLPLPVSPTITATATLTPSATATPRGHGDGTPPTMAPTRSSSAPVRPAATISATSRATEVAASGATGVSTKTAVAAVPPSATRKAGSRHTEPTAVTATAVVEPSPTAAPATDTASPVSATVAAITASATAGATIAGGRHITATPPVSATATRVERAGATPDMAAGHTSTPTPSRTVTAAVSPTRLAAGIATEAAVTGTATMSATPAISATATLTITPTTTDGSSATPAISVTASRTVTSTVVASDSTATITATAGISATPGIGETPTGSSSPDFMSSSGISQTTGITAGLDLVLDNAATLTATVGLTDTAPLTLVVTLPITAVRNLVTPDYLATRSALETVLNKGQALFAQLQAQQAVLESAYRVRLRAVVERNSYRERLWQAQYDAHVRYVIDYPKYWRRVIAYDAYAHRMHLASIRYEQWKSRYNAWTHYAQLLAAYRAALDARRHVAATPTAGPVGSPLPPLPPKPVMPPFPGPEPPPFTEPPPPWPGAPPVAVPNPGPEPRGEDLPVPPEAVPPWDGDADLISVLRYGSVSSGPNAIGREETTQASLLADGAFDLVGGYDDPLHGPIVTYWGGSTIFQSFHTGIDIAAPLYTPIHAVADGVVIWAGYAVPGQRHESYGLCVVIQHNAHISTMYAHMDDLVYGLSVRVGDLVRKGQVIGHVGMTGWTTGPHLHFETRENNVQFNPLLLIPNPE